MSPEWNILTGIYAGSMLVSVVILVGLSLLLPRILKA